MKKKNLYNGDAVSTHQKILLLHQTKKKITHKKISMPLSVYQLPEICKKNNKKRENEVEVKKLINFVEQKSG